MFFVDNVIEYLVQLKESVALSALSVSTAHRVEKGDGRNKGGDDREALRPMPRQRHFLHYRF